MCLQFSVSDDDIVEDPEEITITITMSDLIIGNTTIVIIDNDGMHSQSLSLSLSLSLSHSTGILNWVLF